MDPDTAQRIDRATRWIDSKWFLPVVFAALGVLILGFGTAIFATIQASGADDRALERVKREAVAEAFKADLNTCRTGNRTRPQIAINSLIINDGVLRGFGATVAQRRVGARLAVESLGQEIGENGSAGPRDCDKSGTIGPGDYQPGVAPPVFIDPRTGLPPGVEP